MLVMVSSLHRTYPILLRDFLLEVFLPIVNGVHDHVLRVARVLYALSHFQPNLAHAFCSDKPSTPSSFASFHGLRAYIPADSQFNVPDEVSFIPLPPCISTDTSEGGDAVAPGLGCAGPSSRKRKRTRESNTMDESRAMPARKSKRKRMNKSRAKKEKENTSPTSDLPAFSTRDPVAMPAGRTALVHLELTSAVHSTPPVGRPRRRSSGRRMRFGSTKVLEGETSASTSLPANSSMNDRETNTIGLQAGPSSRTRLGKAKRKLLAKANTNGNSIASTTYTVSQTSSNEVAAQ